MQDLNAVTETTQEFTKAIVPGSVNAEAVELNELEAAVVNATNPNDKRKAGRVLAKERLLAMLGGALLSSGFSPRIANIVGAAVAAQDTKIATDFAFNPDTGKGVMWGWSNGGAAAMPFGLVGKIKAGAVRLSDGASIRPAINNSYVTIFDAGYWLIQFAKEGVELDDVDDANKTAETGVVKDTDAPAENKPAPEALAAAVSVGNEALQQIHDKVGGEPLPEPGVTIHHIDEAPFIPKHGEAPAAYHHDEPPFLDK
jgi:hypothetical protein